MATLQHHGLEGEGEGRGGEGDQCEVLSIEDAASDKEQTLSVIPKEDIIYVRKDTEMKIIVMQPLMLF